MKVRMMRTTLNKPATAFQFIVSCRSAIINTAGYSDNINWISITADVDGTETQRFFLMEKDGVEVRVIQNLPHADELRATTAPAEFWLHPWAVKWR
jgi:hypothetical protein